MRSLVKHEHGDDQVIQKMVEVQQLRDQLTGIRDLVRDGKASEIHLSKEEVEMLKKRLEATDSQEDLSRLTEEMFKLRSKYINSDLKSLFKEKDEQIEAQVVEITKRDAEIQKLKEELEDLDNKEEEIQSLRRDMKNLADKENEIQWLKDELDSIDEREQEIRELKQKLVEKEEEIQELRRDLKSEALAETETLSLRSNDQQNETNEQDSEQIDNELHKLRQEIEERDTEIEGLQKDLKALAEKEQEIESLKSELQNYDEKDSEIERLKEELSEKEKQIQELQEDLRCLAEKESEVETLRTEIQRMVETQETLEEERIFNMASPGSKQQHQQVKMAHWPTIRYLSEGTVSCLTGAQLLEENQQQFVCPVVDTQCGSDVEQEVHYVGGSQQMFSMRIVEQVWHLYAVGSAGLGLVDSKRVRWMRGMDLR